MGNEKTTEGGRTPKQSTPSPTGNEIKDTETKKVEATNDQQEANKKGCNSHKIIYYQQGNDGMKGWNIASVIFNGVVALVTVALIWFNSKAITAANKSADVADSTLTEIKRQFEVVNRPILQIGDIALKAFNVGQKPILVYKMENVGNFAGKVLKRKMALGYVNNITERRNGENWSTIDVPIYVSRESPYTENITMKDTLEKQYSEAVINGILKLLVIGEIEYINEVTSKPWIYEFAIQLGTPPSREFIAITSNNKPK